MKVYLDTIGCRLNQAEIESFARQFRAAGYELVPTSDQADLAVVNTCAVTEHAVSDSRQKIRQVQRQGVGKIIATGCWATLKPQEASELPGVVRVVPNLQKDRLVLDLLQISEEGFDKDLIERTFIPGGRLRTRAFIKVQDGCNNRCTFCVTTIARGSGKSRSVPEIMDDIMAVTGKAAQTDNSEYAKEIVLTGVHLGSWGNDLPGSWHLRDLVQSILDQTDVPRLRLSSLEPWDLDDRFFELWREPRLCRHLHLPLQSGCAATLKRMARKTIPESFAMLVKAARQAIPCVAITTDIIVGFPGETSTEFSQSIEFIEQMNFADGHVFSYSPRPGTAASRMPDQIPVPVRKERNACVRAVLSQTSQQFQGSFIGQVMPVLWESATGLNQQGWRMSGLTDNYLRIRAQAPRTLWNQITPVYISDVSSNGLIGKISPISRE